MSKNRPPRPSRKKAAATTGPVLPPEKDSHPQATRETIESIVVAVILAFLFRTFVAEAFVIPTGSMAPTLMGRHVDVTCPECGTAYRTGASVENDNSEAKVQSTVCPDCRYPLTLKRDSNPNQNSFTGDRILVSKFAYDLWEPERFDVLVFKFPGNAKQNYIKRLIGLPNELIRIRHGDIFIAPKLFDTGLEETRALNAGQLSPTLREQFAAAGIELSEEVEVTATPVERQPYTVSEQAIQLEWGLRDLKSDREFLIRKRYEREELEAYGEPAIARKPVHKLKAMLQTVHDTERLSTTLQKLQWPSRWQGSGETSWRVVDEGRAFEVQAVAGRVDWLRYRHLLPEQADWQEMRDTQRLPAGVGERRGRLIADFYAYNDWALNVQAGVHDPRNQGLHWVGDLAVECEVEVRGETGQVWLDLVEGGAHFRCSLDVASGIATLHPDPSRPFDAADGQPSGSPTGTTSLRGPGRYRLRMSNIDDEVRLWVDGRSVRFDRPTTYRSPPTMRPVWAPDEPGDLEPVGVGAEGVELRVERLRVLRDVYYISTFPGDPWGTDYPHAPNESIPELFRTPEDWADSPLFADRRTVDFMMNSDSFFPLGDNSPQSKDGRLWGGDPYVQRELLTGKAMLIYWPHAWRRPIPFTPNFARMGLIR